MHTVETLNGKREVVRFAVAHDEVNDVFVTWTFYRPLPEDYLRRVGRVSSKPHDE